MLHRTSLISTGRNIAGIDAFRGIAALLVFAYHFWVLAWHTPAAPAFFRAGYMGVDIFFVLSGFLLYQSLYFSTSGIMHYYLRRILRITPIYYFALFVILIFTKSEFFFTQEGLIDILKHLFFVNVFWEKSNFSINPVLWTLALEMYFYAILPLLFWLGGKKVRRTLLVVFGMIAISVFYKEFLFQTQYEHLTVPQTMVATRQFPIKLDQFGIGMLVAIIYIKFTRPHISKVMQFFYTIFTVALGFLFYFLLNFSANTGAGIRENEWLNATWGTIIGLTVGVGLFTFLNAFPFLQKIISNRIMGFLGRISYGIYIWHYIIIEKVVAHTASIKVHFFLSFFLTLLFSSITYFLIEEPFLKLGRKQEKKEAVTDAHAAP